MQIGIVMNCQRLSHQFFMRNIVVMIVIPLEEAFEQLIKTSIEDLQFQISSFSRAVEKYTANKDRFSLLKRLIEENK
mgnify:CR=1 FL=1